MKVAFFTYPSAFQNIGGGEIQLLKTKEYLEKEGVEVHLFDFWRDRVECFDLLHIFGSVKDCLGLAQTAKSRGIPVAVSPVFWSDFPRAFFMEGSLTERGLLAMRHLVKIICPIFPSSRRKLLAMADLILPNSEMEKWQITRLFAVSPEKIKMVPNAVEVSGTAPNLELFRSRYGPEPFILSVGRIEPRKNQLNLIRAAKKIPRMRLVLIGSPVSGYEAYDWKCRREGEGFTTFIPRLNHSDPLLVSALAACEVFVAPGWFETPGLAALEAALVGCRLAVTSGGSTREYFGEEVEYLDPASVSGIHTAIEKALKEPGSTSLRLKVLENFTWKHAAHKTLEAYRWALASR